MRTPFVLSWALMLTTFSAAPARSQGADLPADGWIAWASTRSGNRQVFVMKATGNDPEDAVQVTKNGGARASWSPDGHWIGYATLNAKTHVIRWDGSGDKEICDRDFRFWTWDGKAICGAYDGVPGRTFSYSAVDPDTGKKTSLGKWNATALNVFTKVTPMTLTHDGRYLGLMGGLGSRFKDANGTTVNKAYVAALLELSSGKLYWVGYGCEPSAPPVGGLLYHVRGDNPTEPDIYRVTISELVKNNRSSYKPEMAHEDSAWGHEYWPSVSRGRDNSWMIYGATTGCHAHDACPYDFYIHKLGAGNNARVKVVTWGDREGQNNHWPSLYVGPMWQPPKHGNGMQIVADPTAGGDVFDSGIEIISVKDDPRDPTPGSDRDSGSLGAGDDAGADGGLRRNIDSPRLARGGCRLTNSMPVADLVACWLALCVVALRPAGRRTLRDRQALRARQFATSVGLILVLSLLVFAFHNDIARYWMN